MQHRPTVIVQCVGPRWMLGVTHTDGTWQTPLYCDTQDEARALARQLTQRFASAAHGSVLEDVQLARAFAQELQAARAARTEEV